LRTIDQRLRETAKGLKAWSAKSIGSICTQVLVAKEVIFRLDEARIIGRCHFPSLHCVSS
jgi:hypothetical protein